MYCLDGGCREKGLEVRVKNMKKWLVLIAVISGVLLTSCEDRGSAQDGMPRKENASEAVSEESAVSAETGEVSETETTSEAFSVSIDVRKHYTTSIGDPSNLYRIDENGVLWGCGNNEYGQLGQGTQDDEFHSEMVKMAENVVHVDYSQSGFVIWLTKDGELYGCGMAASGALRGIEAFSGIMLSNSRDFVFSEPVLLFTDVIYACCGRYDVACLTSTGSVWIWGLVWNTNGGGDFRNVPYIILNDAVWITGGFFNHAALLRDGTVWTWGYNYSGNCGIEGPALISEPQKAAEGVEMVWTGRMEENVDCDSIEEFNGEYPRPMDNTVIRRRDGSYWICGANVGDEEKILPVYYEATNYPLVCTSEFLPFDYDGGAK